MFSRACIQEAFRRYSESLDLDFKEHWFFFEISLSNETARMVSMKALLEEAKTIGIKGATKLRKNELIERLWTHEPSTVSKRVPTELVVHKKEKKRRTSISPVSLPVPSSVVYSSDRDDVRCSVCKFHFTVKNCSMIHKYCEKEKTYSTNRSQNTIYDTFHNRWLPVAERMSNTPYYIVEEKRKKLREFDLSRAKGTDCEIRMYTSYLHGLSLYYPSLMTEVQKDYLVGVSHGNIVLHVNDSMVRLLTIH